MQNINNSSNHPNQFANNIMQMPFNLNYSNHTHSPTYHNNYQIHNQQQEQQFQINTIHNSPSHATNQSNNKSLYCVLLGLAEKYLTSGHFKQSIHCLEAILNLQPSVNYQFQIETCFKLCRLYKDYAEDANQIIINKLNKSIELINLMNDYDEFKYEAVYTVCELFRGINQTVPLDFLYEHLQKSIKYPVWYLRLLFLSGDLFFQIRDFKSASYYMSLGIDYCAKSNISYTHILFILCKGLIHLVERNPHDLQMTMQPCANLIENMKTQNQYKIDSLKIFFLILQVTYFLQCGQSKSALVTLRSLQNLVHLVLNRRDDNVYENPLDNFYWLHKDYYGLLTHLLTALHGMQSGALETAVKYSEKALYNVNKIKNSTTGSNFIIQKFQILLHENLIRCKISIGNRKDAITDIGKCVEICKKDSRLFQTHSVQLNVLLGLYAMSLNQYDTAELQLKHALKATQDSELWLFTAFNYSFVLLGLKKYQELITFIDNISPEKIQTRNTAYIASSHFMQGLKYFCMRNYHEAQNSLQETLVLASSENLTSISVNSQIFLAQISFILNFFQDCFTHVSKGSEISNQIGDIYLKMYANLVLKELYRHFNDPQEHQINQKYYELSQNLAIDHQEAIKLKEHELIKWIDDKSMPQIS